MLFAPILLHTVSTSQLPFSSCRIYLSAFICVYPFLYLFMDYCLFFVFIYLFDFARIYACHSVCVCPVVGSLWLRNHMTNLLSRTLTHLGLFVSSVTLAIDSTADRQTILGGLHSWAAKGADEIRTFPTGLSDDKPLELRLFLKPRPRISVPVH